MHDHRAKHLGTSSTPGSPAAKPARLKSAKYVATSVLQRFSANQATDLAATLTYYWIFALFPGLVAVVSIMKLSGIGNTLVPELTQTIEQAVPDPGSADMLVGLIEGFFSSSGAGLGLVIGIGTAMWAAAGYVQAFSRAMNRVYGVSEGRNSIALRIQQLAITALSLIAVVLVVVAVTLSGGLARWLVAVGGLNEGMLRAWQVGKWPVIVVVVMALIATLYHLSPNVRFPRFRPITWGSIIAVVVAGVAATGFSFYAANFGNYNATYGALAGVMIALLLVWLMNVALIFGAHVDAEILRFRQLRAGLPAERQPLLSPRGTAGTVKSERAANKLAAQGHEIRRAAKGS